MEMKIEAVHERDIDLLLIKELVNDTEVGRHIVKNACGEILPTYCVEHSRYDDTGEADIVVLADDNGKTLEILIEDKIDANPQPEQSSRYKKRGSNDIKNGKCDSFVILLIAPQKYLESSQANGYDKVLSYEEIRERFLPKSYEYQLLDKAIEKKDTGYTPVKDKKITDFWNNLYPYIHEKYPMLHPYITKGDRGPAATWIPFKVDGINDVKIQIKSDREYTDLEIGHYAEKKIQFIDENRDLLEGFQVVNAGKSLAVRLQCPKLDFHQQFGDQLEDLNLCLNTVVRLQTLAYTLQIDRNGN